MYHMSETQVELMHRIADAQADAYDFIDEASRLKLMYHMSETQVALIPCIRYMAHVYYAPHSGCAS